jgi:ABC-type Mn2+/Zn2+ transport system ATPase subunit
MSIQVSNLVHPFVCLSGVYPIDISSEKNKIMAAIGNNGSGKTSFLKLLLKELQPKCGKAIVNGEISFLGTKNGLKPQIILRKQLPYFSTTNTPFPWPQFLNMPYQELSAGQQRLIALWLILQSTKPIILLDEPFIHLDNNARNLACTWLNSIILLEKTIILSHHNTDELSKINNLQILDLNYY